MIEKNLKYLEYLNRENDFRHFQFETEMNQYELLMMGSPDAPDEGNRIFCSDMNGTLSKDPLRHYKYLFVAATTIAARYAIRGGLDTERAYNASDLYINRADLCSSIDQVIALHREMFEFYTSEVASIKKKQISSREVLLAIDYIDYHLHEKLRTGDIAEEVGLNPNYLSSLFHKETGRKLSDYIAAKKVETAQNMLKFSDYSLAEISTILAFDTQSYFSRVFRRISGMSPGEYRIRYFRRDSHAESPAEAADPRP